MEELLIIFWQGNGEFEAIRHNEVSSRSDDCHGVRGAESFVCEQPDGVLS